MNRITRLDFIFAPKIDDVKLIAFKRIAKDYAFKVSFVKIFSVDWQKGPLHKFYYLKGCR